MANSLLKEIQSILNEPFAGYGLTKKQLQIANLSGKGYSPKEIANTLGSNQEAVRKSRGYAAAKMNIPASGFPLFALARIQKILDAHGIGKNT